MALSGTITSNNVTIPGENGKYKYLQLSWTATQSIANNTSTISWTLSTDGTYPYWVIYSKTKVVIDGTTVYWREASTQQSAGTIATGTVTLTHNSVGDRSFSASISAGIYEHAVNASATGTWALNNIPRASSVSGTSLEFGQAGTLTVSRASSSFNDVLTYQLGTYTGSIGSVAAGSLSPTISWTPPVAMMNAVPNATTAAVSIICKTYNGSTLIATKTSTVNVAVPSSVVPTASVVRSNTVNTFGVYTQNISKCRVQTTATGAYGSTIAAITTTIEGVSYTGADITSNVLTGSGSVTVKTVVKDSRGRSVTETGTITVSAYSTPAIEFSVHRCDSGGTADEMGAYANVWIHATGTSIGSGADANVITPTLKMRKVGVNTWTDVDVTGDTTVNSDVDKEVSIIVSADDAYSWEFLAESADKATSITQTVTISVGYATIDFYKGGKGIAFGTTAKQTGFECAMDTEFTGDASFKDSATFEDTVTHTSGAKTMDMPGSIANLWNVLMPTARHGQRPASSSGRQTVTVDLTDYRSTNASLGVWAVLVVAVSWVSSSASASMYVVHGLQGALQMAASQVFKESYGPSASVSGTTLTITFYNSDGGGYAVIPLFGKDTNYDFGKDSYT